MWLLNLPEDILIIILKKLDTISLYNLYTVCDRICDVVSAYRVTKICDFSLNILAMEQSFHLNFFKDISRHLMELNVCGMSSLCKTALLPVMKRLKNLKTLNVSYTNIDLFDFLELYDACPNIENISINFIFNIPRRNGLPKKSLLIFQNVFKNLKIVNFVGNLSTLVYSRLPFFILSKSRLERLQYTVVENDKADLHNHYEDGEEKVNFDEFKIYIIDENNSLKNYGFMYEMLLFQMVNFEEFEVIIIVRLFMKENILYVTPAFEQFFNINFKCEVQYITNFSVCLFGNAVVMFWNKRTTKFDDKFFASLVQKFKPYFPCRIMPGDKTAVPLYYDWYYTTLTRSSRQNVAEPLFKKPRVAEPPFNLDYSEQFKEKHEVQLTITFDNDIRSVTLNKGYEYLRKLTYLSLFGPVRYSTDFFNILFNYCDKLTTLNINSAPISSCITLISKSISLSKTIKNLRIVDNKIDFKLLFSCLSKCMSLENVNLCDISNTFELSDPSAFFNNCTNLYCLYVYGHGSHNILSKKLQILKNARKKCNKLHIRVNVFENSCLRYDPFVGVFKLNPIQP